MSSLFTNKLDKYYNYYPMLCISLEFEPKCRSMVMLSFRGGLMIELSFLGEIFDSTTIDFLV